MNFGRRKICNHINNMVCSKSLFQALREGQSSPLSNIAREVASFERFDPNLSCTKSSVINALIASPFGAGIGLVLKNNPRNAALSGMMSFFTVFIFSNVYCINKQINKEITEAERGEG